MLTLGFILLVVAGTWDGSFYLPAKFTKKWEWEHNWAMFSVGFLVMSWLLILIFVPNIFEVYSLIPMKDKVVMSIYGLLWGVGAILFGTTLHLLGMALGYPIGLGTVACCGTLVPLVLNEREKLFTTQGLVVIIGLLIAVVGIVVCSRGFKAKESGATDAEGTKRTPLAVGLIVAVFAGVFSAMLNIGFSSGDNITNKAKELLANRASAVSEEAPLAAETETIEGAQKSAIRKSDIFGSTACWPIFCSAAFVVNILYCLFLMVKKKTLKAFWGPHRGRNIPLGLSMGALFMCAVYMYSMGATCLGSWGEVPGWITFISIDIVVGNLWGYWTGEWKGAPKDARRFLNVGMVIMLVAVTIVSVNQYFSF